MTENILRVSDILISILLLVFFLPIIILISILILVIDGKPILYKQIRVGYFGRRFKILKFRTMSNNVFKNDNLRLTSLGKILRKTSLDELPQLINVLKKDMSIVGPRPLPISIEKKINESVKTKRRMVLPGITGLSQINYTGKNRKLSEKVHLDLKFIEEKNIYKYFQILFITLFVVIIRFIKNKSSIIK